MTRSEAGRLGAEKSKPTHERLKQERIEKYNENPSICLNCGKSLPYEKRQNKFCSHSCNAIYNNLRRKINIIYDSSLNKINNSCREKRYCENCGKELKNRQKIFCSNKCQNEQYYNQFIQK